jgi:hypothetical protein
MCPRGSISGWMICIKVIAKKAHVLTPDNFLLVSCDHLWVGLLSLVPIRSSVLGVSSYEGALKEDDGRSIRGR